MYNNADIIIMYNNADIIIIMYNNADIIIMYNNAERIGMDTKRLAMPLCRENRKTIKDHQFSTYANFFKKNISYTLMHI